MSLAFSFSLTTFKEINVFLVGIVSYCSVKNKRKLAITGQIPTTKKTAKPPLLANKTFKSCSIM